MTGLRGRRPDPNGGAVSNGHTHGTCSRPGCSSTEGWQCSYRDASGRQCGWWCRQHVIFQDGRAWCQRHATIARELASRRNTIYDIKTVPALEDRSPALASMIVEEVDGVVRAALAQLYTDLPGLSIVTDPTVRMTLIPKERIYQGPEGLTVERSGFERLWQRGWGVYSTQGYLARITVTVTASEPPSVEVLVNGLQALSGVPDWIAARSRGQTPAPQERAVFRQRLVDSILGMLNVPTSPGGGLPA
jgi:hypothetical protein